MPTSDKDRYKEQILALVLEESEYVVRMGVLSARM